MFNILFEYCRAGLTRCGINLGITTTNILYKPFSGSCQYWHRVPDQTNDGAFSETLYERCDASINGCCLGCGSAIAGLFGYISSLLLCGQLAAQGALHQIRHISFLRVVRYINSKKTYY